MAAIPFAVALATRAAMGKKYDVIDADEPEVSRAVRREVVFVEAVRDEARSTGGGALTPACRAEERVGLDLGAEEWLLFLIQYPPAW